jgi:hypothetical protein
MARPGLRLAAEQLDAPSLCAMSIVDCENQPQLPLLFRFHFRPPKKKWRWHFMWHCLASATRGAPARRLSTPQPPPHTRAMG